MSESKKQEILHAIAELQAELGKNKVSLTKVAERVPISRQGIYKDYKDLLPYIKGKRPISEVLDKKVHCEIQKYSQLNAKVVSLENHIKTLEVEHENAMEGVRLSTFTNLMRQDIEIHGANVTKSEHEKTMIQLNNKINDLKTLQYKNNALEIEVVKLRELAEGTSIRANKVVISSNMDIDAENFRSSLRKVEQSYVAKLYDQEVKSNATVIVFINRFNACFNSFVQQDVRPEGDYIYIHLSLPTARERKKFIRSFSGGNDVIAVVEETSEAQTKWYRTTRCRDISLDELKKLDELWQDLRLNEGFKEVTYLKSSHKN